MATELTSIPNVGPAVARKLDRLGVSCPDDLRGRDPHELFERLCALDAIATTRACATRSSPRCPLPTAVPRGRGGSSVANARRGPVAEIELRLGWVIAYVRDPFGTLIELATPL